MKSFHLVKSLSWLIVLNLLVKPIWIFVIDRQVQVIIGNNAYGTYFALFNFTFILSFIGDAGLSNLMNQRLASNFEASISRFIKVKVGLLLTFCIISLIAGWIAGIKNWEIFLYLILINVLTSVFIFSRAIISAHQHFSLDAILSVIDKFLMISLCVGFIYGSIRKIDLILFLQLQMLSTAASLFLSFFVILRYRIIKRTSNKVNAEVFRKLIPFAVVIFLMSLHYRLDGFLLSRLNTNGQYEAGVYAAAYRLLDAGNMVGYLAAGFLVPYIARYRIDREVVSLLLKSRNILLLLALFGLSFIIIYSSRVQDILYHSSDIYISRIITLVLISLPAYYLVHIYGSIFTAHAEFRVFIWTLLISVSINIVGNVLLIPFYGAFAAAVVSIISQYTCGLILFYLGSTKYGLEPDFENLLLIFTFFMLFLGMFYIGEKLKLNMALQIVLLLIPVSIYIVKQLNYIRKNFSHA